MVISDFTSKTIFLDTAPLIYFIEGHSVYQPVLAKLFDSNDKGEFSFITSSITMLEVLVKPMQSERADLIAKYKHILTEAQGIDIFEINNNIAEAAAILRAKNGLKTPDALQLAVAMEYGADYFLTNDLRLKGISEMPIITLADLSLK